MMIQQSAALHVHIGVRALQLLLQLVLERPVQ